MKPTTAIDGTKIRDADDEDLEAVQAIYAHHVLDGLSSFEEVPPDTAEMARRRADILARRLPFLVAECEGAIKGFAYAVPYRSRSAYRYTLENSVYVASDALGRGLGERLLRALIDRCAASGYRQMVAIIGDTANSPSINLHRKVGFAPAGTLRSVGFKFGRWVDSVVMQRSLGEGDGSPPADAG